MWWPLKPLTIEAHDPSLMYPAPGEPRPLVAGTLSHDALCAVANPPGATRIRELFGHGFTFLAYGSFDAITAATRQVTAVPVAGYDLTVIEPAGLMVQALGLAEGQAALTRPDGHIAALGLADPAAATAAVGRALAAAQ